MITDRDRSRYRIFWVSLLDNPIYPMGFAETADTSETGLNQIMGIEPKYVWEYSSRSQKLKLKNCAMIADYSLRVTLEQNLIIDIIS